MLLAGYVPDEFGVGVTFPIPKGSVGRKLLVLEDFRGITVSPIISKILEKCLIERFSKYLWSDDHQFGFKKDCGCSHAIYALKSVMNNFSANGSTINICFLDVSKAFDRVNHFSLFSKLMNRNVPINIVNLLSSWYGKSVGIVNWHGTFSHKFSLSAGVRQGGCLSPILFSIHVNVLIEKILQPHQPYKFRNFYVCR